MKRVIFNIILFCTVLLIGFFVLQAVVAIMNQDTWFGVARWYEGKEVGFCNASEGKKWIVIKVGTERPIYKLDGVRGWHFHIVGSDGKNYSWFHTDVGCVRNFFSEPNGFNMRKITNNGNLVFYLPEDVEPELLVLDIEGDYTGEWKFDSDYLDTKQREWLTYGAPRY